MKNKEREGFTGKVVLLISFFSLLFSACSVKNAEKQPQLHDLKKEFHAISMERETCLTMMGNTASMRCFEDNYQKLSELLKFIDIPAFYRADQKNNEDCLQDYLKIREETGGGTMYARLHYICRFDARVKLLQKYF